MACRWILYQVIMSYVYRAPSKFSSCDARKLEVVLVSYKFTDISHCAFIFIHYLPCLPPGYGLTWCLYIHISRFYGKIQKTTGHYSDLIMGAIASQITSLTIFYSTVYSDADQRKHQSSTSLAFVRGIHRGPVNSPHKWPVTRKMFPFDDVAWCDTIFSNSFHDAFNGYTRCKWAPIDDVSIQINSIQFNATNFIIHILVIVIMVNIQVKVKIDIQKWKLHSRMLLKIKNKTI